MSDTTTEPMTPDETEDLRRLFLETLMVGDVVKVVPLTGEIKTAVVVSIDTFYITAGSRQFDRRTGKDKHFTRHGRHIDDTAHIEPLESIT